MEQVPNELANVVHLQLQPAQRGFRKRNEGQGARDVCFVCTFCVCVFCVLCVCVCVCMLARSLAGGRRSSFVGSSRLSFFFFFASLSPPLLFFLWFFLFSFLFFFFLALSDLCSLTFL
eukprot:TRINITY_DN18466_c2_g1_i1.p4 TRINITY_DN18466_c2_g1~~TRINITY_DN18466_c2_g1_i1.p4  ORF type:complete len:118 (-),score=6.05 TRINITY_DN18466_c2_g1_i1:188-541(-)